ncbi:hypothetical protein N7471_005014 [Penicillium samsonianum]|uniref:uncharacterized protein n=1 Tax=Penicillium samsonianum TaxID=1882272 RepID=UPI0025480B53|nr:uncharacterized protein N7471_005014 [Penicillium samsonianum]KAJ6138528.1 hypothetical protein N7471_005014 [Penicillium samsonianum]
MDYSFYDPRSQQSGFSLYGLPTPDQPHAQPDTFAPLNNYQNFPGFDPSFPVDPSFVPAPHSPPESVKHSASSDATSNQHTRPTSFDGDESQFADPTLGRSSSEEKESAPAQSKRKAQNRAAQRAFRERKEQHVRDLEEKVSSLEQASDTLQADNERLKRELARFTTENEILRATSQHASRGNASANENPEPTVTGPMKYSPTDFHATFMADGPRSPQHRLTVCPITGEKLLDAGATWDLIQKHELFERGQLDIGDVTERLKGMSQCDGQGPAFIEGQVRRAIEESAAVGRDELI